MPQVVATVGDPADPDVVRRAVDVLATGRLLIYPTDTFYALGGRATEPAVPRAVMAAKGREEGKPLPLIAASTEQARALAREWPASAGLLAARFWPGPLTLVVAARPALPEDVTLDGKVAVRVPGLALARALCVEAGPLVSTSANRAGASPSLTCAEAVDAVGRSAALALDCGPGRPEPSTIVDVTGQEARLVREGAVAWSDVQGILRGGRR